MDTIDQFLAIYKQEVLDYYLGLMPEFKSLDKDYEGAKEFRDEHGAGTWMMLINLRYDMNQNGEPTRLLEILDRQVISKKATLIAKITKKAGEIVDTSGLYIALDMNINGVVIGTEKTVTVRTILAGGYNIQKLHYRVLVN